MKSLLQTKVYVIVDDKSNSICGMNNVDPKTGKYQTMSLAVFKSEEEAQLTLNDLGLNKGYSVVSYYLIQHLTFKNWIRALLKRIKKLIKTSTMNV